MKQGFSRAKRTLLRNTVLGVASLCAIAAADRLTQVSTTALGQAGVQPPPPPPPPPEDDSNGETPTSSEDFDAGSATPANTTPSPSRAASPSAKTGKGAGSTSPAKRVPPGQEMVSIDFPEPTEIKDIIKAVGQWTGKNFILSKNVSAKVAIISPQQVTKEEAYQAFLSALNVAGFTTVETGKVVKIVPTNVAPGANIKTFYGASWAPMTDEMITQIIPLTYIQASDIANQIKNNLRLINNVWAFPATNALIVSDTGHKVRKLLELIRMLDVKSNQPQFAIEQVKSTDAGEMSKKIQELFGGRGGASPYLQKVLVDQRSNSLLLVGPPKGLDDVVRVIRRLDKPSEDSGSQAQIHVRPLNYADSEKLASVLQSLAQGSRSSSGMVRPRPLPGANSPAGAGGTFVADLGDVKITSDKATNALIIQGSKGAYMELDNIIQALDKRRDQVYIEVDIVDISVGNDMNIGLSVLAGASAGNGRVTIPFGWKPGGVAPFAISNKDATADQQAAQLRAIPSSALIGVLGGKSISVGGMSLTPGAFIFALKTDSNANVLQTPSILVADNEDASFEATERQYVQNTSEDATTKIRQTKWEPYDAALQVKIKPQISKADFINLDINLTAERFDQKSSVDAPPNKNTRKSTTKVTVQNQQTIVISGLTRDIETDTKSKVPLLGDIPILGWLFRDSIKTRSKTNLAMFITPYIVRNSEDLASIYEKKVRERDEFLKAFYGSDVKNSDVFARMPNLERGKVPTSKTPPAMQPNTPEGAPGGSEGRGKENNRLPSEDPNPVVVPGATGGAAAAPMFGGGDTSGGGANFDSGNVPPPPPPPSSPSDQQ